jgi:hypothetical protein
MLRYVMLGLTLLWSANDMQAIATTNNSSSGDKLTLVKLTESQKVEQLIQFIRNMKGATFIRNGSEHSCREAADHLQSKWNKHKKDISSAKEFIEVLASKSGMSGEPYKIKFKDGTVQTTNAVLMKELKRLESL